MLDAAQRLLRASSSRCARSTPPASSRCHTPLAAIAGRRAAPARRRRHRDRPARGQPAQRAGGRGRPVPRAEGDRMSAVAARARRVAELGRALARARRSRASKLDAAPASTRIAAHDELERLPRGRRRRRAARRRAPPTRASPRGDAAPLIGMPIAHKDIFVTRGLPHHRRLARCSRATAARSTHRGRAARARPAR